MVYTCLAKECGVVQMIVSGAFGMLDGVFGMEPQLFFEHYIQKAECKHRSSTYRVPESFT